MGGSGLVRLRRWICDAGVGLAVLICAAPLQAQVSAVIEVGGLRQELAGTDVDCVYDGTGLRCKPPLTQDSPPAESPPPLVTFLGFSVAIENTGNTPAAVQIVFTLPTTPRAQTLLGGSVGGSVTDTSFDGSGGLRTVATSPLYRALIDNVAVASLYADPAAVPGGGAFDFAGESVAVPAASFGLPGPSVPGPAVMTSFGVNLTFEVAAGDTAGFTGVFGIKDPEPGETHTEPPAHASEQLVANEVAREIQLVSGAPDVCPRSLSGSLAFANPTGSSASITIIITLPVMPIPMTVIGGSISGSVTDTNFNSTGGIGTTMADPLYRALIDDMSVAQLYPATFNLPGPSLPGTFSTAGETVVLPGASFGLPGPSMIGPAVAINIGLRFQATLAPGDAVVFTAFFIVDCPAEQGEDCAAQSQCVEGLFCSQGVCCDRPCDGFIERCDVAGNVGTCTAVPPPVPVASRTGLMLLMLTLLVFAAWSLLPSQRAPVG